MDNLTFMMLLGDHAPQLPMGLETPEGYLVPLAVETTTVDGTLMCVVRTLLTAEEAVALMQAAQAGAPDEP